MNTKRTYITPVTKYLRSYTENLMQATFDIFSGGDPVTGIVIDEEGDDSDGSNRANRWKNNVWE